MTIGRRRPDWSTTPPSSSECEAIAGKGRHKKRPQDHWTPKTDGKRRDSIAALMDSFRDKSTTTKSLAPDN